MTIIPMKLPPGVMRNGTRYQAKGRWFSANRVRWHNGSMRPIGGWTRHRKADGTVADDLTVGSTYVRDVHAWRDNAKSQFIVWGSSNRVVWQKPDGTIENINTGPVVAPGPDQPAVLGGYGSGLYGIGPYGVSTPAPDQTLNAVGRWKFDTWGENLLALADWDGNLYEWTPVTGNDLVAVSGAPTGLTDFIVTQERIVMTIGGTELRTVTWSDQEDNTQWTDAASNQAGSYVLPGSGELIGIYRLRNQILIITETDAWVARYIGAPYVYSFEKVGDYCAPVHRSAATLLPNGALLWYGSQTFWIYDGSVREFPCDLIDFLKADIDTDNVSKVFMWINSDFKEVWFHYPSVRDEPSEIDNVRSVECGQYVSWNYSTNIWSQGELQRTAGIGKGVYTSPQLVSWTGKSYKHEQQSVAFNDGVDPEARTGPLELGEGERNMAIRYVYPDSQQGEYLDGTVSKGSLSLYFQYRQQPNGTELTSSTYTFAPERNQPIATRVNGRDIMLTLAGNSEISSNWEWGDFRLDVAPLNTGVR